MIKPLKSSVVNSGIRMAVLPERRPKWTKHQRCFLYGVNNCTGEEDRLLDCLYSTKFQEEQSGSGASVFCYLTECERGWQKFDMDSSYCFHNVRKSWNEASEFCSGINSHLVWIESEKENDFLKLSLFAENPAGRVWIGMDDIEEEDKAVIQCNFKQDTPFVL
ncbi:putative aggrecan core protein [Apostichopus japonicus]|uniref:Putative aggrecan core protein n=1 Tax=Stichopus japonicus TaxID=307972 RepID=A0A2G8JJ52_STIJA|nr:putative aggrecan core protein [Apostichopus japonicus]